MTISSSTKLYSQQQAVKHSDDAINSHLNLKCLEFKSQQNDKNAGVKWSAYWLFDHKTSAPAPGLNELPTYKQTNKHKQTHEKMLKS